MRSSDFLDLALGQVPEDDPRHAALGHEIAADPVLAERFGRLTAGLDQLLDDGTGPEPPTGLGHRTMLFVERQKGGSPSRRSLLDRFPSTIPFRWSDIGVAAAVFIGSVLTLVPATYRSRMQMGQLACLSNLHQLGVALNQYAMGDNSYPFVAPDDPLPYAGAYKVLLHDARLLDDLRAVRCPSMPHPDAVPALHPMGELCELNELSPDACRKAISGDYAYHRGIRLASGRPGPLPAKLLSAAVPLLADQPHHDQATGVIHPGNSRNHGGGGQNVLFSDGRAVWLHNRYLGSQDRDLFLNQENRPAVGINALDASLGPAVHPVLSR